MDDYFHLETGAKLLKSLEPISTDFSKCALKSLDNQAKYAIDTLCGEVDGKAAVRLIKTWRDKAPSLDRSNVTS